MDIHFYSKRLALADIYRRNIIWNICKKTLANCSPYTQEVSAMKCGVCDGTGKLDDVTSASYQKIIDDLNAKTGKKFKAGCAKTRRLIGARMREGFTCDDFYKVHTIKVKDWLNDEYWAAYLRPETIYGTKFESYLNQPAATIKNKVSY
jgi:uncharacterized phage protein (TIGR02220 family)